METVFINEQDCSSQFAKEASRLRGEGENYVKHLEQEQGINTNYYIHELGNIYWMQDCDLNTNVSYLMKQVRNNYMRGMSALAMQIKAERERDMLRMFVEKAGLKDAFQLFEKQVSNFLTPN